MAIGFKLGVAMIVVGTLGYYADRSFRYTTVQAVVEDVTSGCELKTGRRRTNSSGIVDCAYAERAHSEHSYSSKLVHISAVTVRFTSPVDNEVHTGTYTVREENNRLSPGQSVDVLASKSRPELVLPL
jgi:hypothetical protein